MENVSLTHSKPESIRSGIREISSVTWSTSSAPKATTNTTISSANEAITMNVAKPRFMRRASRSTAGAIAIAANHAIRTVKMTLPPSRMMNWRTSPSAITARTTRPTRQTLPGRSVTSRVSWVMAGRYLPANRPDGRSRTVAAIVAP